MLNIDLNPVRAGLVDSPEEYRWSSPGYRFRSSRKDEFLSWNLGLKEYNVKSPKERLRLYREFVYARGGVDTGPVKSYLQQGRSAAFNRASKGKILDAVALPESVERFIQRTRFFSPSETTTPQAWFLPEAGFHRASRCRDHRIQGVRPPGLRALPGHHKAQARAKTAQDTGLGQHLLYEAAGEMRVMLL